MKVVTPLSTCKLLLTPFLKLGRDFYDLCLCSLEPRSWSGNVSIFIILFLHENSSGLKYHKILKISPGAYIISSTCKLL